MRNNNSRTWLVLAVLLWVFILGATLVIYLKQDREVKPIPVLIIEEPAVAEEPETVKVTAVSAETPEAVAILPEPGWFREEIPLDYEVQQALHEACLATGLREEIALAVIRKETTYRNVMGDGGNSYGYMQVQPRWHADRMERLGVTDLMDPYQNFLVGCDFLMELTAKYDLPVALTVYNSGKTGVSDYAKTVMQYLDELTEA